jgi:hypothetical protein
MEGVLLDGRRVDPLSTTERVRTSRDEMYASAPLAEVVGIGPVEVVVSWFTELRKRMGEGN